MADQIDLLLAISVLTVGILDLLVFPAGFFIILRNKDLGLTQAVLGPSLLWVALFVFLFVLVLIGVVFGYGIHGSGASLTAKILLLAPFFSLSFTAWIIAFRLWCKPRAGKANGD